MPEIETHDVMPEVTKPDGLTHAWAWFYEGVTASHGGWSAPLLSVVWPLGCTREEALTKRPSDNESYHYHAALIRIPLDREWLVDSTGRRTLGCLKPAAKEG